MRNRVLNRLMKGGLAAVLSASLFITGVSPVLSKELPFPVVPKASGYTYTGSDVMYLAGLSMTVGQPDKSYGLCDINEDGTTELFVAERAGKNDNLDIYVYNTDTGEAELARHEKKVTELYMNYLSDSLVVVTKSRPSNTYTEYKLKKNRKLKKAVTYSAGTDGRFLRNGRQIPASKYKKYAKKVKKSFDKIALIPAASPWVNSSVIGAASVTGDPGLKNDFRFSADYSWLKEEHLTDEKLYAGTFEAVTETNEKKLEALLTDSNCTGGDVEIVRTGYEMATDWESRNRDGADPVRRYINAVRSISSLPDMNAFITDVNADPFTSFIMIGYGLNNEKGGRFWEGYILPDTFSRELETEDEEWGYIPEEDSRWEFDYRARYVLSRAGYTNTFIDESMAACYQMEDMLIAAFDPQKYEDNAQYTMAELSGRCKAFPIAEVLRAYNVNSDSMIVTYIDILEKLGELYTEENLSLLKGYLTAHIAAMACARLDFEAQAIAEGFYTYDYSDEAEPLSDEEILEALNENARQLAISPFGLTGVALENAYITNYTEPEEKKDLMRLTLLIRDSFKELLQNEPWMSQESRDNAVKKLEAMTFNIVSPDELIDASYLLMDKNETYLTASMDAAMRKQLHDNAYIGTELDRNGNIYDIVPSSSTTITNSFNFQDFNRFFICGGIIGEGFYTKDMSEEEKLAAIGAVIGHEMTHGFDPDGVQYDSEGVYIATEDRPWGFFTEADHNVFKEKVSKMETYFNKIWPFPEAHCDGELLTGEATADMGGIAIALNIAKDIEGFDYDRYFRAYSNVWKSQGTYENELWDMFDEHPLNYIRINATLQQFDEFLDTYGIKEGDGMYLPLEERVKIW